MEDTSFDLDVGKMGKAISAKEAAALLGVSERTVHRMFDSGELEFFRVRRCKRTLTGICEMYIRKQMTREAMRIRLSKKEI